MPEALPPRKRSALLARLRTGQDLSDAAQLTGIAIRAVFTAARTDTALTLALAGVDPDEQGAAGITSRADYLRLLALGCTPTLASQILFDGAGQAGKWRSEDLAFGAACDAAAAASPGRAGVRAPRFTPERRQAFLVHLEAGLTVTAAAAEIGITTAVVYQRRRRDPAFAAAMTEALRTPRPSSTTAAVGEEQWKEFYRQLRRTGVMRRAALAAGIQPEAVYQRRRSDPGFAEKTDRLRDKAGRATR
ncbi:hypothetical protein ACIP46_35645 [Streptomyces lavendulae]|uniref:hypothetical protein n=2 Tax=Streptomyces lavendulae TaxID=1914 RepID=UPI0037FAD26C